MCEICLNYISERNKTVSQRLQISAGFIYCNPDQDVMDSSVARDTPLVPCKYVQYSVSNPADEQANRQTYKQTHMTRYITSFGGGNRCVCVITSVIKASGP